VYSDDNTEDHSIEGMKGGRKDVIIEYVDCSCYFRNDDESVEEEEEDEEKRRQWQTESPRGSDSRQL
jgi:hypothetical protein